MKLQPVPLEWVNRTWAAVEPFIESAAVHSNDDYTTDQIRTLLTTGVWHLIVITDGATIHGAITVSLFNRPNARVAFVTAIGGRLVVSKDTFEQLRNIAAAWGATEIEGAVRDSIARLWRRYGFKEKYKIVGVKL